MVKKFFGVTITFTLSIIMLALLLIHVSATETEKPDSVLISNSGKVKLISDHGENDGVNTLQLSLNVKSHGADSISFEFDDSIDAKIMEYRYNADENRLNIYIAGTQPLFAGTDSLIIGAVRATDSEGQNVAVDVNAIEDSLKYVYSTELKEGDFSYNKIGDANDDGKITIRDAAHIAIMLAKGLRDDIPYYADYNEDGTVNIRDAAAIAIDRAKGIIINE